MTIYINYVLSQICYVEPEKIQSHSQAKETGDYVNGMLDCGQSKDSQLIEIILSIEAYPDIKEQVIFGERIWAARSKGFDTY